MKLSLSPHNILFNGIETVCVRLIWENVPGFRDSRDSQACTRTPFSKTTGKLLSSSLGLFPVLSHQGALNPSRKRVLGNSAQASFLMLMTLISFLLIWELICWASWGHLDRGPSTVYELSTYKPCRMCPTSLPNTPPHFFFFFFAVFLLCLSVLWTQLVVYLVQPQHCERASLPGALLHHEQLGPLRWWIPQQAGRSVFRLPPRGEESISDEQVTGASKMLRSAKFREGSHFGDVSLRKY